MRQPDSRAYWFKNTVRRYPSDTPEQNFDENFCVCCQAAPCNDSRYDCSDDPDCLHPETEQCSWCAEWKPILANMNSSKGIER